MLTQRPVDTRKDKEFVLDLVCLRAWEDLPKWARSQSYFEYRDGWMKTSQPQELIEDLEESLRDERTVAEVWLESDRPLGFLWVTFSEIGSYGVPWAEVRTLAVSFEDRYRGIGELMLLRAEEEAKSRGAVSLRSEMTTENEALRAIHGNHGFEVATYQYEKLLAG